MKIVFTILPDIFCTSISTCQMSHVGEQSFEPASNSSEFIVIKPRYVKLDLKQTMMVVIIMLTHHYTYHDTSQTSFGVISGLSRSIEVGTASTRVTRAVVNVENGL